MMAILFYWPLELRFLSVSTLSFLIWTTLESSQILLSGHPHPLHTLHLFLSMKGTWGEMAISNFILFPFILPFWRKIYFLPLFSSLGFPDNSVKESAYNAGNPGSIPGLGRFAGEGISYLLQYSWASLVTQLVKNPPAMWESWVWSLGWEDPLEKRTAIHSSILAWRISWTL